MIRENQLSQTCAEVYELLNVLGKDYIDALPEEIFENISKKRDLNYENKFNINDGISEKNFSEEAINILLGFDLKYWSSYIENKNKIALYKENEAKYQAEIKEKYNPNNIFENKSEILKENKTEILNPEPQQTENLQNTELIPFKESIFSKIKNIFNKILKN